jgi:hypothetical protein
VITLRRIFLGRWLDKADSSDPLSTTHAALQEAQDAFKPGTITTPITLFNSVLPWGTTDDQTLGWHGHSSAGVRVYNFPTLFDTMIEGPDVRYAAPKLREVIDEILAEDHITNEGLMHAGTPPRVTTHEALIASPVEVAGR